MIELDRSYRFDAPIDQVWTLVMDTTALSACIPGCEALEPLGDNRYTVKLVVKLAAVMGSYTGSVQLVDVTPTSSYGLIAEGNGRPGFVKGNAAITLEPEGATTVLTVKGQVQTGGAIARVGQRLIRGAAGLMMDRFFRSLKARAEGRPEDAAVEPDAEADSDTGAES